jgi:damage-control phosphatase, subfamily I
LVVCRAVRPDLHTFLDYVLASVIGNTFDYGVQEHLVTSRFQTFFDQAFSAGLTVDDTDLMLPLLDRVVYITDNCGEIVFDRLLIEHLVSLGSRVTLAVRDGPVLNDATLEDARALGLDHMVETLTTTGGGGELGVNLAVIPPALAGAIRDCTLIISKGMANYESLSLYPDLPPVAYLMSVKCGPVGEMVGMPVGSMVALLRC